MEDELSFFLGEPVLAGRRVVVEEGDGDMGVFGDVGVGDSGFGFAFGKGSRIRIESCVLREGERGGCGEIVPLIFGKYF